jgi:hypothetical protein
LTDQNILADFAKNDKEIGIRLEAVRKLIDQNLLVDFAKNDKDEDIQKTAIRKIYDQSILTYIAKNDKVEDVRITSILSLSDPTQFLHILVKYLASKIYKTYGFLIIEVTDTLKKHFISLSQEDKKYLLGLNGQVITLHSDVHQDCMVSQHTDYGNKKPLSNDFFIL